jgi:hypothetical protein
MPNNRFLFKNADLILFSFLITKPISNSVAVTGMKRGEACNMNILGIIVIGDGGITAARQNGGISKVATVDRKIFNVLFLLGQTCTIVTGE